MATGAALHPGGGKSVAVIGPDLGCQGGRRLLLVFSVGGLWSLSLATFASQRMPVIFSGHGGGGLLLRWRRSAGLQRVGDARLPVKTVL